MSSSRRKPANVVLDMLRSARSRQRTARSLVSAGELFGYTANTMRVTLSRLMARGLIESPERGLYRLTSQTDALNQFVEGWRDGEARVQPWDGETWLMAHIQGEPARSHWALDALGFREVRPALFARPANLREPLAELRALAISLGMDAAVMLASATPDASAADWQRFWRPDAIDATYEDALLRLDRSARALADMPLDEARLECFTLGGEMIQILAKDPLLPGNWIDTSKRQALRTAMRAYDAQGKDIWAAGKQDSLRHMPRPQLTQEIA